MVNAKDYSPKQLHAWATGQVELKQWNQSFPDHYTLVVEIKGKVVGFGNIDKAGYLDRLFMHADYRHLGIATAICNELERQSQVSKIVTHASITAKSFFTKRGYKVITRQ